MPSTAKPAQANQAMQADTSLISSRLLETRRNVKLVDVCTSLARLLAGIMAYLLLLAIVDHWIVGLSPGMRLAALVVLVLGTGLFLVRAVLPLLMQSVNPLYAAHTIEQAAPSLKNSLVNLLLISHQRSSVRPVIYDGMRRQAAGQLAHVSPEAMVDRSPLIRAGYWLVALLAVAACYKVLSPKDPLQTVARVAAPWKSIDRPSRVTIRDVTPGDTDLYRGQSLEVEATILGLADDESATLVFSTDDRQFVDQTMPLEDIGGQRFRTLLAPGSKGIQQSLDYYLTAGDASSDRYRVLVKDAPHIHVTEVEYQYPGYTGLPPRQQLGHGDLSAIEGTRVVITAKANQAISAASLELYSPRAATDDEDTSPDQALSMKHQDDRARGRLTLLLQPDRKTARSNAYQLRFTTMDGQRNVQPARYQIEVSPDLPPDVEILAPLSRDLELPENGRLEIEMRAFDPDFAIRQLRIVGASAGQQRLSVPLLEQAATGQVVRKYQLIPRAHQLRAGDELLFWAEAEDNRHDPSGNSAPNTRRTENYRVRILPSADNDESPPRASDAADQSQAGESGDGDASEEGDSGGESGDQSAQGESGEGESEQGESEQGDQASSESGSTGGDAAEPDKGTPQDSTAESGQSDDSANESESGSSQAAGTEGQDGETDASDSPTEHEGGQPDASGEAGESREAADDAEPVASDGSNDSEAFDRILRHRRDQGSADDSTDSDPSDASSDAADESGDSTTDSRTADDQAGASSDDGSGAREADDRDSSAESGREQQADDGTGPSPSDRATDRDTAPPSDTDSRSSQDGAPSDDSANAPETSDDRRSQNEVPDRTNTEPANDGADRGDSADQDDNRRRGAAQRDDASQQQRETSRTQGGSDGDNGSDRDRDTSPPRDATSPEQTERDDTGSEGSGEPPDRRSAAPPDGASGRAPGTKPGDQADSTSDDKPPSGAETPPNNTSDDAQSSGTDADSGGAQGESTDETGAAETAARQDSPSGQQASNTGGANDSTAGNASGSAAEQGDAADEANLEYSRRATDLALEHLQDQQDDSELLDRLGWTKQEMQAFVKRWREMRAKSRTSGQGGERARQDLNDQLRGLGLQPPAAKGRRRQVTRDRLRNLRQGGGDTAIPAAYRDQYRAFLRSVPDQSAERSK